MSVKQTRGNDQRGRRRFTPTPKTITAPGTIADQLRQHLLGLSYPAFAQCLCVLLEALGYEEVQPAGRQEWKGYNRPGGGGYDLEAFLPGGLAPRRAVAQIKQFDGLNVYQRSVDELRGACLRCGAAEAILVTTSAFSSVVLKHAVALDATGTSLAPVRLIDGKELLGLLIRHRLGVRETSVRERAHSRAYRLELDEAFFQTMSVSAIQGAHDQGALGVAEMPLSSVQKPLRSNVPDTKLEWNLTIHLSGDNGPTQNGPAKAGAVKGGR